ncbi:MAG: hypothetical protein Q8R28_22790 [Dehalococcoidia bacterium]|nr:hypothetical protein [Dehalococcoidia bacterium]
MVKDTGKTPGADTFRPVNVPGPVRIEERDGLPVALRERCRHVIAAISDRWRIDDEWWRSEPISRLYFSVLLDSGQRLVIYKDLSRGGWYRQGYKWRKS